MRARRPNRLDKKVYFIADGEGRIKIGISNQPLRRAAQIMSTDNCAVYPLACFDGNEALERKLHARFRADWLHHEWFRQSPALEAFIRELQACENYRHWPCQTFEEVAEQEATFARIMAIE